MADKATIATTDPLAVVLVADGPVFPALLLRFTQYVPAFGDVVVTLPLAVSDGSVLVLGPWSP